MLTRVVRVANTAGARAYSSSRASLAKVTVLGAAGGIGQPMSLLLKDVDAITHLSLYDLVNTPGVAADLSHINSRAKVTGHKGADQLKDALTGADVVVIPAGVPRKPGMTRDDLFNTNASIVATLADACAKFCPKAHLLIISNPVNSTVPITAEIMKRYGAFDPKKVYGVTTLDVLRANTFVSEALGWHPRDTDVTVVGGHAGITILPLLSQLKGAEKLSADAVDKLTVRVQFGGDEVVKAKDGAGSATLSMAYAGARFVKSLLRALAGEKGVSECAYVASPVMAAKDVPYFSTRITLGKSGVEGIAEVGKVSAYEQAWLDKMLPELKSSIDKGVKFAADWKPKA